MAFKKPPTKSELRRQLEQEVRDFLDSGGAVNSVAPGVSGRDANQPMKRVLFDGARETRTYVNDIVASVDARRKPTPVRKTEKRTSPKLKTIYDDFGEPLRRVWVDD
jgi:hypothetical protein